MFDRILKEMWGKVRAGQYVMTLHAEDETDADGLSVYDVESAVLTGKIVERQMDRPGGERKYVIRGRPAEGSDCGRGRKARPDWQSRVPDRIR